MPNKFCSHNEFIGLHNITHFHAESFANIIKGSMVCINTLNKIVMLNPMMAAAK